MEVGTNISSEVRTEITIFCLLCSQQCAIFSTDIWRLSPLSSSIISANSNLITTSSTSSFIISLHTPAACGNVETRADEVKLTFILCFGSYSNSFYLYRATCFDLSSTLCLPCTNVIFFRASTHREKWLNCRFLVKMIKEILKIQKSVREILGSVVEFIKILRCKRINKIYFYPWIICVNVPNVHLFSQSVFDIEYLTQVPKSQTVNTFYKDLLDWISFLIYRTPIHWFHP